MLPNNYLWGFLTGVSVVTSTQASDNLSQVFANPPPAAHPHTWWHWNNGNVHKKGITPLFPTLRSDPMALSGASRRKQIPSSRAFLEEHRPRVRAALRAGVASRYFNGGLDDSALFRGAMSATDIGSLAKQSVATFSCLSASANVALSASSASAWEDWRAANFNSTELADPLISGPNADKDHSGIINLLEYATATNPGVPNAFPASANKNGANLEFTYTRSKAAFLDGPNYTVEWNDA